MKIIYKSSVAKEQIEARNKFKCNGIELQMFSPDDSFEATKHSNHRVHSIHYPFIDDQCYFRKLFKTSALPDFEKTLKAAQHFKCGVVLHCEMTLDEFKQEFENGGVDFCRLLSLYKGVPIYLENSIEFIFRDGFENNMLDIPTICEILNLVVDNKQFFPLLDICHIASYFNTTLNRPAFGWSDIIEKYNSSDFNIHFNYALGNGLDERHGVTLKSNPELLESLLLHIVQVNPEANLILEVSEDDYIACHNAESLHIEILKVLSKYKLLNIIEKEES